MEYETAGDPISGLKWTHKTPEKVAKELTLSGIIIGTTAVRRILHDLNFSLKSNAKNISSGGKEPTKEEKQKRDIQFSYINKIRKMFETENIPTISCDTKKKEIIGNFKNFGTRYKQISDLVNDHDFLIYCIGKAVPKQYQKGLKADKSVMKNLNIKKHEINASWNYTIFPQKNLLKAN